MPLAVQFLVNATSLAMMETVYAVGVYLVEQYRAHDLDENQANDRAILQHQKVYRMGVGVHRFPAHACIEATAMPHRPRPTSQSSPGST